MAAQSFPSYPCTAPQRISRICTGIVIAAHVLVVCGLLHGKSISQPSAPVAMSVRLLPLEAPQTKPEIVPPKPRPMARKPLPIQTPTLLAAPVEMPAPTPTVALPAPTFAEPVTAIAMSPASIPTQPRFDATYLDNPKPPYPGISRRLGEQGRVVLRIHVTADGLPQIVQIHTSSGYARLDDSALETVRRWKFVAAKLGNEPVAATVLVPIIFSLKG
ncbi:MAG: energy transducer TonB [Rugosibacter sp.]|nr:MAG: energy transducer TonB [Rugosibacter sp.]TBR14145.1 MAG: energy transducer TonB [Rugosibacter sp.]